MCVFVFVCLFVCVCGGGGGRRRLVISSQEERDSVSDKIRSDRVVIG